MKAIVFDCFGVLKIGISKNTELLEYIRTIKNKNVKIGLLSSVSSDWITKEFLTLEERLLFDDMVFSYKERIPKSNPEIFKLACSRLKVLPNETIFVDDTHEYCEAAESLGIKAIRYIDFNQTKTKIEQLLNLNDSN